MTKGPKVDRWWVGDTVYLRYAKTKVCIETVPQAGGYHYFRWPRGRLYASKKTCRFFAQADLYFADRGC